MGSCAAPSAKGDDKFITTDYLQQCQNYFVYIKRLSANDTGATGGHQVGLYMALLQS